MLISVLRQALNVACYFKTNLYKIKTYKAVPVASTLIVSILLFSYILYLFHFDKSISVLFFLTFFFLLQFIIERYFTYEIDIFLSDDAIETTWHSKKENATNRKVLFSDIVKWNYVSNNMAAAFIIWTKENERLSVRVLNFFTMQKSLVNLLNNFSSQVKGYNNHQPVNIIKKRGSFYETKNAKYLAVFALLCSLVIIILMFAKTDRIDSLLWLRSLLVLSTNVTFILLVYSKTESNRQQ
jgi:hypothetical protein